MASKKDFSVSVGADSVVFTNISASKDGYSSARMVAKMGDNEYMSISYEWEGSGIPSFAMDLMSFMKNAGVEKSGVWEGKEDAYEEYSCKTCKKHNPEKSEKDNKGGLCPDCGKKKEECVCKEDKK
jgi:DNA-directed RNA polymerase subunit RPC12/RpoP